MRDAYTGEAMFLAWGDGPAGAWVKILLPDSDALRNFRGMTKAKDGKAGQLLAVKMVEVDPDAPHEPERRRQGPMETLALRWCRDALFLKWLAEREGADTISAEDARTAILTECDIEHRAELDTNATARKKFNDLFRHPFMAWKEATGNLMQ